MDFNSEIELAKSALHMNFDLKKEQLHALKQLSKHKNVVSLLPTGFGKSAIYQIFGLIHHKQFSKTTIVISPLNAIIKQQVRRLNNAGMPACYLDMCCTGGTCFEFRARKDLTVNETSDSSNDDTSDDNSDIDPNDMLETNRNISNIGTDKYAFIFTHPEALLSTNSGKKLLKSLHNRLSLIAIDEAHMIYEWGESFRPAFGRLQEISVHFPNAPTLVLTATATTDMTSKLMHDLGIDAEIIKCNPDRPNIMYHKYLRKPTLRQNDDLDELLCKIGEDLSRERVEYPITIMYTNLENISYYYSYLDRLMKNSQYEGEQVPENRLFGMYHANYTEKMKDHIVSELAAPNSKIRVIFATVALGMGLDARNIRKVIHFGSPTSIEKYLQETGRAGRDGKDADAVLYYNATDLRSNRPGQQASMVQYCKSENTCLRQLLLNYLNAKVEISRNTRCCQVCQQHGKPL